jgi:hypothetical protein
MERQKIGWLPVVMYVLAIILGIYAFYALISTSQYIGQMVSTGYVSVSDSFGDIVAYYVTNVGVYIFYAAATAVLGYIVDALQRGIPVKQEKPEPVREKAHVPEVEEAEEAEEVETAEATEEAETAEETAEAETSEEETK